MHWFSPIRLGPERIDCRRVVVTSTLLWSCWVSGYLLRIHFPGSFMIWLTFASRAILLINLITHSTATVKSLISVELLSVMLSASGFVALCVHVVVLCITQTSAQRSRVKLLSWNFNVHGSIVSNQWLLNDWLTVYLLTTIPTNIYIHFHLALSHIVLRHTWTRTNALADTYTVNMLLKMKWKNMNRPAPLLCWRSGLDYLLLA